MAHLISAGNVVTMCTNSDETYKINSVQLCSYKNEINVEVHSNNLNTVANSIANTYEGNMIASARSINWDDFYKITELTGQSCLGNKTENTCGHGISLIDIGERYWFSDYSHEEYSYDDINFYWEISPINFNNPTIYSFQVD